MSETNDNKTQLKLGDVTITFLAWRQNVMKRRHA